MGIVLELTPEQARWFAEAGEMKARTLLFPQELDVSCKKICAELREGSKPPPPKREPERFDDWWAVFPRDRKGSKRLAEKKYIKTLRENPDLSEDYLINRTMEYARSKKVRDGYASGAVAWLNDDGWTEQWDVIETKLKGSAPTRSITDWVKGDADQA